MEDVKAAASQNFTFGVLIRYLCDRPMLLIGKGEGWGALFFGSLFEGRNLG